ncbi:MAG TPA: BlaI/MecI/CopY family transcriptional regulator [Thermoanaerobaculia bacterium]|nr:BlaI/MecI/CopY family transcriptional regulator [Thermoanaerobaculia bacterium]
MPRRKNAAEQLTPLELEIMKILWESGPASVQEVQQRVQARRELAYTTVQTMLNILVRKGRAKRTLVDRAYRYRAAISREKALGNTLRDVVHRMFGGSAEALVLSLIETRQLTPETLQRLNDLIAVTRNERDE